MSENKRFSLIKPTIQTAFHIDFDWWKQHDNNWRIHLQSCLCQHHQDTFDDVAIDTTIDWVDPVTAEVKPVDGLQHILIEHCSKQEDFITDFTTLVNSVFRVLLANGNRPMTIMEIATKVDKLPQTLLRTLGGHKVYKGIRPKVK
ncbi:MAG: hypothetical protein JEZ03_10730 [Bacteroidales bacterium]|nr:hypothetical protein [Bacteroidales bacterium]